MRDQLADLSAALAAGTPVVWCTVVETRGSTPQKAGAVMLVRPDGSQSGTLGGGCIEAEVKQRALAALGGSESLSEALLTFNLDDDYGWDDGLICGGRMTILAESLAGPMDDYFAALSRLVRNASGFVQAVSLDGTAGTRVLFDDAGNVVAGRGPWVPFAERASPLVPDLAKRPSPSASHGMALLPTLPRVTLLIVGGGHVGQAVARLASDADFAVEVVDDRAGYIGAERFPSAQARHVGDIGATLSRLGPTLTPEVYALIVTRGHNHDEEALYHLAPTAAGYVGMIGSRRKIRLIYDDLVARGVSPAALERVHAPLGIDIGSQTVPEIAVSIVAELIAFRNLGTSTPRMRNRVKVAERVT